MTGKPAMLTSKQTGMLHSQAVYPGMADYLVQLTGNYT